MTPEEKVSVRRGRGEIARGDFVTFEKIKHDLEVDCRKKSGKTSKEVPH